MGLKRKMKVNVRVTLGGLAGGFGQWENKHKNEMKMFCFLTVVTLYCNGIIRTDTVALWRS